MKYYITTLLLSAIPFQLRFTFAFPFNSYSDGNDTLDTLSPVNVTSISTPQTAVIPSANLMSTNLTISPWPPQPFFVTWRGQNYTIDIEHVFPWTSTQEPIDLEDLIQFVSEFAGNLQQHYPPPALAPPNVGSTYIDGKTFTRWTIDVQKAILAKGVPVEVLLLWLGDLEILLRRHGPASLMAVIYRGRRPFFFSAYFNLSIDRLGGNSSNISSLSENNEIGTS